MAIERHILEGEKGFDYRLGMMMNSAYDWRFLMWHGLLLPWKTRQIERIYGCFLCMVLKLS